ncbi:MAG TPA: hypothetical protein VJU60_02035 [Thermoleophilaceae bacterium]|nr:hypothetical protein [Thermoleophilaceae bacterium]
MPRRLSLLAVVFALFALASTARAATIWTQVASGTTGTISSIVYQSPTRFWYATSGGTIAYWNGSGFTAGTGITPGENFVDLAFQPTSVPGGPGSSGLVGYGVTGNGHIWRSNDGGVSWTQLAAPFTRADCSSSPAIPETELNAVQWANGTTVFLVGDDSTILRSTNATAGSPTFLEFNKVISGTCAMQGESSTQNMTDATFLPANPANALFVAQDFGRIYQSSNALSGSPSGTNVTSDTVDNFSGNPHIAQDPTNPNRIWVVDHEPGDAGCGKLCLVLSTDEGQTSAAAKFPNDPNVVGGLYDISSQGGVEVTAGSGGEIFTSVDGTNFYDQPADGALATENWRAEAAFDAQHAAVGGENGALVVTSAAGTVPSPVAPPAPGPGPTTGPAAKPSTGSRPITIRTGGATIKIFRIVTVTGRSPRFVPVIVSAKKPRKFSAQVLPLKGRKRALASGHLTLRRKHGGHGTIRIKIPANVKPGSYDIAVRVTTLKGKRVGKLVKVKFRLK